MGENDQHTILLLCSWFICIYASCHFYLPPPTRCGYFIASSFHLFL